MEREEFAYEIVEHIATLSESGNVSKELNRVSWKGKPAKYDLRSWKRQDGAEQICKGLTLTTEEAMALKAALNARTDI